MVGKRGSKGSKAKSRRKLRGGAAGEGILGGPPATPLGHDVPHGGTSIGPATAIAGAAQQEGLRPTGSWEPARVGRIADSRDLALIGPQDLGAPPLLVRVWPYVLVGVLFVVLVVVGIIGLVHFLSKGKKTDTRKPETHEEEEHDEPRQPAQRTGSSQTHRRSASSRQHSRVRR